MNRVSSAEFDDEDADLSDDDTEVDLDELSDLDDDDIEIDDASVAVDDLDDLDDDTDEDTDDADDDAEDDEEDDDEDEDDDDEDDDDEDDDEEEESLDVLLAREKVLDEDDLGRVADESRGALSVRPALVGAGEFTCRSCFLVKRRAQLADEKRMLCFDCA